MAHEARQVLEVAPELINLFRRTIYNASAFCMNALVAVAELKRADHIKRGDCKDVSGCERESAEFCFRRRAGNTQTDKIQRIAGDACPDGFSRFFLRKDCNTRSKLARTVQSY